jgi:APA family basic amino acid/polyamine antiporter
MPDKIQIDSGAASSDQRGLLKNLGLLDATTIVAGSMIGSGIFIVSADISRQVGNPALLIVVWVATGLMTMMAALCYGELAAAMPKVGGEYAFLRESFGPMWGFLYGWAMLLVIQTATIAAVAIAFANFTGVLLPWFSSSSWILHFGILGPYKVWFGTLGPFNVGLNTQNLLAIVSLIFLTWINTRSLRASVIVQNIFTLVKITALGGLILLGFGFATQAARTANFSGFWHSVNFFDLHAYGTVWVHAPTLIGLAMVGALFSSSAWPSVTFIAAEVRNPSRNLPLSLAFGTGLVMSLYVLANFAYLHVLPLTGSATGGSVVERGIQFASQDRVGTAVAEAVIGPSGAVLVAIAVMISTFGCNNGLIMSGARIYYAMAEDKLFFRRVGTVNRHNAPSAALWMQCAWACILCLSGTYRQLLDFVVFSVVLFYILTIAGLFWLRIRRPEMPRPYKVLGYPVMPGIYLAAATFVEVQLLRYKPQYTWPGLLIVLSGIPVYWLWRRLQSRSVLPSERVEPDTSLA